MKPMVPAAGEQDVVPSSAQSTVLSGALSGAPSGPSSALQVARESAAVSLSELSQKTRISVKQLESLEAGRYNELPGIAFVKGALRSCAKVLNVDAQPLLDQLHAATGELTATGAKAGLSAPVPTDGGSLSANGKARAKASSRNWLWGTLALALVAIGFFFANPSQWRGLKPDVATVAVDAGKKIPAALEVDPKTNSGAPSSATSAVELSPTGPSLQTTTSTNASAVNPSSVSPVADIKPIEPGAPTKSVIEMQFTRDSWVEVRQADGKVINNQLHKGGTKAALDAQGPVALIIGGAAGVSVNWQGQPQDLKPYTRDDVARVTLK